MHSSGASAISTFRRGPFSDGNSTLAVSIRWELARPHRERLRIGRLILLPTAIELRRLSERRLDRGFFSSRGAPSL
jgi:hypothetical protein